MVYELKEFMMKMVFNWYTSMVWIFKTTSGCFADLIDNHKAYYSTFLIMALTKDSVVYELKEFMMKMLLNWPQTLQSYQVAHSIQHIKELDL